jgi:type I restriction enzyme, R subunit
LLPDVFRDAVRSINRTDDDEPWLTGRQLDELRDQILRQPNRTVPEVNEAIQGLRHHLATDSSDIAILQCVR